MQVSVFDRIYSKIFIAIVLVLFLLPVMNSSGQKMSTRTFWRRDLLIELYANMRLSFFGDRVFENVLIGDNKWLIYISESSIDDYQKINPFSDEELRNIQVNLDALHARLEAQGIHLLVIIAPDKNTIYPEFVPEEILVVGDVSRLDQFISWMQAHGTTQVIDFRPELMQARESYLVYYPYDSHWSDYGAFLAYQKTMLALAEDFPQIEPHALTDFQVITGTSAKFDLAENIGTTGLATNKLELTPLFEIQTTYRETRIGRWKLTISENPDQGLPSAVIYYDSFFNRLMPLLGEHFRRAVYVPNFVSRNIWNLSWIDQEEPDIVILEFAQRYIDRMIGLIAPSP